MKHRSRIWIAVTLASLSIGASACRKTAEVEREKAAAAQREAEQRIAEAEGRARTEITSAETEAQKKVGEATSELVKLRNDFRQETQSDLDDSKAKIDKLEAKAKTETGQAKLELDAKLRDIRAKHEAYRSSLTSLDAATAATWDETKSRVEKARDDLKRALDAASPLRNPLGTPIIEPRGEIARDAAIERLATARCNREARCKRVGAGQKFATSSACLTELRSRVSGELKADACPRGVSSKELDQCLASVGNEDCNNPLETVERLSACRTSDLCMSSAR